MAVFNYAGGEISIKIVYYGPGLSGKTTNLELIYSKLPRDSKGKMVSMKTRTDRTLFFDFLPIDVGEISGMKLRFLLYTVPGQVYYNATRKLVLKGVDAVVFVADSAPDRMADNKESLINLGENLNDLGLALREIPWVMQFNKRDLPEALDTAVMQGELNTWNVPAIEAVATTGKGVYETFEAIARSVYKVIQANIGKEAYKATAVKESSCRESISVEVVAQGNMWQQNSEADKSDSLQSAEERKEEHESVSEFVDSVLTEEDKADDSINLGATREGYEDYGHLVDLNDDEDKRPSGDSTTKKMEIISDPFEKPQQKAAVSEPEEGTCAQKAAEVVDEERIVRVPVMISEKDIGKEVPVKVILEIKVGSD